MTAKRSLLNSLKLILLLFVGAVLYHSFAKVPPPPAPGAGDNDADDKKYIPIVPVNVGTITRATLRKYVDGYGTVEPEPGAGDRPAASARVGSPMFAIVRGVACVEGQHVDKGQILFSLEGRTKAGPVDITSPLSGTVVEVTIKPGEVAGPRRPAVTVVDLNRLVVAVDLPVPQLLDVAVGQAAEISQGDSNSMAHAPETTPSTRPAYLFGNVVRIDNQVDPKTGLGSADVSITSDSGLRLGEFMHVRIVIEEHRDCLTVPAASIVNDTEGRAGVSLVEHDFHWAYRHPVRVGLTDGDRVEIEAPELKAGQPVVTTGAYALTDSCRIDVVK